MIRFEEHHQEIREMISDFSDEKIAPGAEHLDETQGLPKESIAEIAELEMLGLTIPEEHGGAGLDLLSACLVVEEISRNCGSTGAILSTHLFEGTSAILRLADDAGKERWLPDMASGKTLATFALAEREAESDASAIDASAGAEGDGFVIHGRKTWIMGGMMAGLTTVIARRGEENLEDLGAFVIDPEVEGCEREPMEDLLGLRGAGFCNMNLNGVDVSGSAPQGEQ